MSESDLNDLLASSYGIFAGKPKAWATIRFSPHAARWVAEGSAGRLAGEILEQLSALVNDYDNATPQTIAKRKDDNSD